MEKFATYWLHSQIFLNRHQSSSIPFRADHKRGLSEKLDRLGKLNGRVHLPHLLGSRRAHWVGEIFKLEHHERDDSGRRLETRGIRDTSFAFPRPVMEMEVPVVFFTFPSSLRWFLGILVLPLFWCWVSNFKFNFFSCKLVSLVMDSSLL